MRKEGRSHLTALFVCTVTSGFLSDFDQSQFPPTELEDRLRFDTR